MSVEGIVIICIGATVTWLITHVLNIMKRTAAEYENHKAEQAALDESYKKAVCTLIEVTISNLHREYIQLGWITKYALKLVMTLHKYYVTFGGNGTVALFVQELSELPKRDIDTHHESLRSVLIDFLNNDEIIGIIKENLDGNKEKRV